MKPFNCEETIAIQGKLVLTCLEMELPTKYSLSNHVYIYSFRCELTND